MSRVVLLFVSFQFASFLCIQQSAERGKEKESESTGKELALLNKRACVCIVRNVAKANRLATWHVDKHLLLSLVVVLFPLGTLGWFQSKSLINCVPSDMTYHLQWPRAL